MPIFEREGKAYHNPVELAHEYIGGRWKMPILWRLYQRVWRYGEMKRDMPGISHKMLSQQLKELESRHLLRRRAYPVIPPKVEYAITTEGKKALPAIEAMRAYGLYLKKMLE